MPKPIHEQPGVFHLYIHTDNDAFADDPSLEIARIVQNLAVRLAQGDDFSSYRTLFDSNGNDTGRAKLNPQESR